MSVNRASVTASLALLSRCIQILIQKRKPGGGQKQFCTWQAQTATEELAFLLFVSFLFSQGTTYPVSCPSSRSSQRKRLPRRADRDISLSPSLDDEEPSCDFDLQPSCAERTGFCMYDEAAPWRLEDYAPPSPEQQDLPRVCKEKCKRLARLLRTPEETFFDCLLRESTLPPAQFRESLEAA